MEKLDLQKALKQEKLYSRQMVMMQCRIALSPKIMM